MKPKARLLKISVLATLLLLISVTLVSGAAPNPTYGSATVDGNSGEWDLTNDWFADMYLAGKPGDPPDPARVYAKLYLRYDCGTDATGDEILYALVLAQGTHTIDADAGLDEHYIKLANSTMLVSDQDSPPPDPPGFAWVSPVGDPAVTAAGWEASAYLLPGFYSAQNTPSDCLNVHSQIDPGQTSAVQDRCIDLYTMCQPSAVSIASFTATPAGNAILLTWETTSEFDNAGFNLHRAGSPDGPRTQLNAGLILSQLPPGSPLGATYQFVDESVRPDLTYYYWLEDMDVYGVATLHGPISARLAAVYRLLPGRPRLVPMPVFRHGQ